MSGLCYLRSKFLKTRVVLAFDSLSICESGFDLLLSESFKKTIEHFPSLYLPTTSRSGNHLIRSPFKRNTSTINQT